MDAEKNPDHLGDGKAINSGTKSASSAGKPSWFSSYIRTWKTPSSGSQSASGIAEENMMDEILTSLKELKASLKTVIEDRNRAVALLEKNKLEEKIKEEKAQELQDLRQKIPVLELKIKDLEGQVALVNLHKDALEGKLRNKSMMLKDLQEEFAIKDEESKSRIQELMDEAKIKDIEAEERFKKEMDDKMAEMEEVHAKEVRKLDHLLAKKSEELSDTRRTYEKKLLELEEQNSDLAISNRQKDERFQTEKKSFRSHMNRVLQSDFQSRTNWVDKEEKFEETLKSKDSEIASLKGQNTKLIQRLTSLEEDNQRLKRNSLGIAVEAKKSKDSKAAHPSRSDPAPAQT